MASIEFRGSSYRMIFRYACAKFSRSLKTDNFKSATASCARLEDNVRRLEPTTEHCIKIHIRHLKRVLGVNRRLDTIDLPILQEYNGDEALHHFETVLLGTKWTKLRGWHIFRHSFCSNCAAKGIDQRMINAWVGHQSDEMVRRYRHLLPNQEHTAIVSVFS